MLVGRKLYINFGTEEKPIIIALEKLVGATPEDVGIPKGKNSQLVDVAYVDPTNEITRIVKDKPALPVISGRTLEQIWMTQEYWMTKKEFENLMNKNDKE